jgi:hypothetical protein
MSGTEYLSLSHAAQLIGSQRNGRPIHPGTLTRWIIQGVRLQDGERVRLQARRFPAGWRTTREWLDEFATSLTRDRLGQPMSAVRSKHAERAIPAAGP